MIAVSLTWKLCTSAVDIRTCAEIKKIKIFFSPYLTEEQSISKWENDKAYPEMTRLLFMSDYFDVSLDYLMRGIEKEDNDEIVLEKYKKKNILLVWNNFLSNLSKKQKILFMLLYILIICALVALIISVIYLGGYEIGKFIGYLTK